MPYHDPARIAVILAKTEMGDGRGPVTPGDFEDFRQRNESFEDIAAATLWGPTLTGFDRAERLRGLTASATLFDVLGIQAAHGRLFQSSDGAADAPDIAVLTYGLFQRLFGADPSVIGRTITLDGKGHTIIGVTPREFYFPPFWTTNAEIFSVRNFRAGEGGSRGPGFLRLFGRLKPGVPVDRAAAEIRTIAGRLAAEYPRTNAGLSASVTPIHEMSAGDIRPVLVVLFAAVLCTLLIACANLANLLVARAGSKRKETAIRQSLGAERSHLLRLFLAETFLLSVAGGVAGLLLAGWIVPVFVAGIPELTTFRIPRRTEIAMSGTVVFFNFAVCAATALFCGILTALNAGKVDLIATSRRAAAAR
jgi:predicted permease